MWNFIRQMVLVAQWTLPLYQLQGNYYQDQDHCMKRSFFLLIGKLSESTQLTAFFLFVFNCVHDCNSVLIEIVESLVRQRKH